ncbi:hypothetical protein BDK51DRAFT_36965 [Blyttiomyces helicus]|uniref:Uncharacterized protein n=1 Tax=Blyttiomyces helicus TaxID=388810 RepID=A0A4P9W8H9_9FUNG|nr:hypothetical protein BDK51DRAFT_36965 [Blyttiomyces helicus]|eukprot:RKO88412.1 hypothetical protein BDK51DRAFT_36965 [Blyttiomyces helicus]
MFDPLEFLPASPSPAGAPESPDQLSSTASLEPSSALTGTSESEAPPPLSPATSEPAARPSVYYDAVESPTAGAAVSPSSTIPEESPLDSSPFAQDSIPSPAQSATSPAQKADLRCVTSSAPVSATSPAPASEPRSQSASGSGCATSPALPSDNGLPDPVVGPRGRGLLVPGP